MRIDKALWFFLIVGLVYGVGSSLFWLFNTGADADYYSSSVFSIVGALLCAWFVKSVGSIARHILWRTDGYAKMPIFIYPVFIRFTGKIEFALSLDPTGFWSIVTPPGYIDAMEGESTNVYEIEKRVMIFEVSVCVIIAAIAILSNTFIIVFAIIFFVMIFSVIANIRDNLYHGQISRMLLIKEGFISHYAAHTVIINGGDAPFIVDVWTLWEMSHR